MIPVIILLVLFSNNLLTQDIHYSQFEKTRSIVNPSLIFDQETDYELQLQRRSQWYSVTRPFNTFSLSLNAKDAYKSTSIGTTIINDIAGDSRFSTQGISVSASKKFSKKEDFFSFGMQLGFYQRGVIFDDLIFLENEQLKNLRFSFFDIGWIC